MIRRLNEGTMTYLDGFSLGQKVMNKDGYIGIIRQLFNNGIRNQAEIYFYTLDKVLNVYLDTLRKI